jgi:hypothetical protein
LPLARRHVADKAASQQDQHARGVFDRLTGGFPDRQILESVVGGVRTSSRCGWARST